MLDCNKPGVPAKRAGCVNLPIIGMRYNIIIYKDLRIIVNNPAEEYYNNLALMGQAPVPAHPIRAAIGGRPYKA